MKSKSDSSSLGKKTLRTSFGNIGHSIANAFGKAFFPRAPAKGSS